MKKIILIGFLLVSGLFANDIKKGIGLYAKGSYKRAAKVLPKGCAAGDARSCYFAGYLYSNGLGVNQDMKMAIEFYKKGCAGKMTKACKYYDKYTKTEAVGLKQFHSEIVYSK